MNEDVPKLRITSSMSLEQAMLEVRKYLAAKGSGADGQVPSAVRSRSAGARPAQFSMQAAMTTRLSEIAARLGGVEPHSKLGPLGVFLKRVVRKAIGWYSRPVHEFDRAAIELFQQIRQDMVALQQQIAALQEPNAALQAQPIQDGNQSEPREALLLMIELFKSLTAVQSFRRALRDEDPKLLRQVETLLDKIEDESRELRAALARSLDTGKQ